MGAKAAAAVGRPSSFLKDASEMDVPMNAES